MLGPLPRLPQSLILRATGGSDRRWPWSLSTNEEGVSSEFVEVVSLLGRAIRTYLGLQGVAIDG